MKPVFIGVAVAALVGVVVGSGVFKGGNSARLDEPTPNFRVADYRSDGSRFASSGNTYVFDGIVESIETIGSDRIVSISLPDDPNEYLPLLVPGNANLQVNLSRGDRFLFETSCRTGRTADGGQVKGVLVVKNAQSR